MVDPGPKTEADATRALDAVHRQFSSTPYRPTGPTGATGALADLIDELDWLKSLAAALAGSDMRDHPPASERALRELSATTLVSCAALIDGRGRPRPDREALERGRSAVIDDLLLALSDRAVRQDVGRLWAVIFNDWTVRVISYAALDVARYATTAAGLSEERSDGPAWLAFIRRQSVAFTTSGRVMVAHFGVRSIWFRNSLRGAVGLSFAVLLAQVMSLQHAFWAVLGALSVLRSSALSTGATIVQAAVGTLIGIVMGGVLLVCVGTNTILLWLVLPVACLLAAYAPRAISFAAGQAGFTVAVFVVFDIIEPTGWQVGLVRLEDVSIGFGISLLVARQIGDTPRPEAAARLLSDAEALRAWYVTFGESLDSRAGLPPPNALDPLEHATMLAAVRDSAAHGQRPNTIAALACTWVGLHLDELRRLEARVARAAVQLQER